eukprot:1248945-Alexandrium_andersonii.AAC.1
MTLGTRTPAAGPWLCSHSTAGRAAASLASRKQLDTTTSHAAASAGCIRARTRRSRSSGGTERRGESSWKRRCRVPC